MALPPPILEPDFDPERFDIRHVLDIGLGAKRGTKQPRTNTGWTAGNLGYCLRRQWLERAGVEAVEDYPLRTFWIGDLIQTGYERMMSNAGLLITSELHLVDEDLELSGYVDMIWGGKIPQGLFEHEESYKPEWQDFLLGYRELLNTAYEGRTFPITGDELKTANDYSARKMQQEGAGFHHKMQAASYGLMLDRNPRALETQVDRWRLSVIDKSDGLMNVFEIREAHSQQAEERVRSLGEYWRERALPPCTCGVDISWEKNYCKYRDANGCCDPHLVEKATSAEFWGGFVEPDEPELGDMPTE